MGSGVSTPQDFSVLLLLGSGVSTPQDFFLNNCIRESVLHRTSPQGFLDQHSSGLLRITAGSVLLWTSPFNLLDQHSSGLLRITSAGSALLWASPFNLLDQYSSGLLRLTIAGSVLLWTSPFNFAGSVLLWTSPYTLGLGVGTPLDFSVYSGFGSQYSTELSPQCLLDWHSSGLLRISAGSALLWASPYNYWISAPLDFSD